MDAQQWIDETPADAVQRERRARIVRARVSGYDLSASAGDLPPYVVATRVPEWAARWGDSVPPVGTVLRWTNVDGAFGGLAVAVSDDEWLVTAESVRGGRVAFEAVARMVGNLPVTVAIGWREIPAIEARPAGDAAVSDWASQFIPRGEAVPASQAGPDVQTGG